MLCESCQHAPSMRRHQCNQSIWFIDCYCQCHDVADAAPELLEACKVALVPLAQAATELQSGYLARAEADLRAAIALAEGGSK